jgi:hypothetical protein
MPSFKIRDGRVTAIVRYKGISVVQTFAGKTAASAWARDVETAIDRREWPRRDLVPVSLHGKWFPGDASLVAIDDSKPNAGWSLHRALSHYDVTVTEGRKGWQQERNRIRQWQRVNSHPIATPFRVQ